MKGNSAIDDQIPDKEIVLEVKMIQVGLKINNVSISNKFDEAFDFANTLDTKINEKLNGKKVDKIEIDTIYGSTADASSLIESVLRQDIGEEGLEMLVLNDVQEKTGYSEPPSSPWLETLKEY